MKCSKVGAVDVYQDKQVHVVLLVRNDQSDIQIQGSEASGGSAP